MQDDDEVTLAVPLGTVCYIAERAKDLMGKAESTIPDDAEGEDEDDPEAAILEDRGEDEDSVEQELISVISDLNEDAQIDLVALMWLGREPGDWAELRALAEQEHTEATAQYLCGTPLLATYLLDGLDALGLDCSAWREENY
ncbi:DUF3775 domain-containing protein [Aquicoccus sp. SCR17]|nr:DUF3775 domain-containing protein [Carideicomes alvinocaridis]